MHRQLLGLARKGHVPAMNEVLGLIVANPEVEGGQLLEELRRAERTLVPNYHHQNYRRVAVAERAQMFLRLIWRAMLYGLGDVRDQNWVIPEAQGIDSPESDWWTPEDFEPAIEELPF